MGAVAGPHITRYELRLAPGVKMAKVANLKNDLAYALAATDIRILAPIPGKRAVGVEVPNRNRRIVTLGDVFAAPPKGSSPLTVWLGKDVAGARSPPTWPGCRTCSSPARPAPASPARQRDAVLDPAARDARTRSGSCSSTPSRSSSTTTRRSRTC